MGPAAVRRRRPEGVVAVQYPPLPFYASGAGTGLLGDIMAWKQFKTGIAPTSSWWAGDSPTITGCVDDGNGLDAAERANFVEANEFPTDPDGDWYCANAGFSAKDLILGSAYVQRKFETPVVVEQGPGQAFVIRRIDFDITGTDNADDTLRDLCGWTQSLSVNDAIAGCGAAYGDITPIMIIGRDMVTNQTRRLTLAEFDAEFHFSNELIFDPPAAAQFELVHAEVQ